MNIFHKFNKNTFKTQFSNAKKTNQALLIGILLSLILPASALADEYDDAKALYTSGQEAKAIETWKQLAENGDIKSQFALGAVYATGSDMLAIDDAESIKWFRAAAEQGHPVAQYNLGNAYERGRGVTQSNEQAALWWQKAADQEHAPAQFNLGTHYFFGRGVEQNSETAEQLWRKAALQNHAPAQFNLATLYKFGPIDLQNQKKAMHWYRVAARNGHEGAQKYLLTNAVDDGASGFPREPIVEGQDKNDTPRDTQSPKSNDVNAIAASEPIPLPEPKSVEANKVEATPVEAKKTEINIVAQPTSVSTNNTDSAANVDKTETEKAETIDDSAKQAVESAAETKTQAQSETLAKAQAEAANTNETIASAATKAVSEAEKSATTTAAQTTTIAARKQPEPAQSNAQKQAPANVNSNQKLSGLNITHRDSWIRSQDSNRYTLQLAAFRDEKRVIHFLREHNLNGDIAYFKFTRDDTQWYAIVYGSFASSGDAKSQIASLPKALQKPEPWLRRFSSLQKLLVN